MLKINAEVIYLYSIRTGLALEAVKIATEKGKVDGIETIEEKKGEITITRVNVINEAGEKACGKPIGTYITLDMDNLSAGSGDTFIKGVEAVAEEIKKLSNLSEGDNVLVVGLGNNKVTPDALGPKAIENIMVTRHLKEHLPDFFKEAKLRDVSAIAPGVLGQTGVETAEIIKSLTQRINPKLIIVIDALASRKLKRLASTIQITNTGITPGGGIGTNRAEISQKFLNVPVLSIGVPTVVDAATLAMDVIDETVRHMGEKEANKAGLPLNFTDDNKYGLIKDSLAPYDLNLVTTPKEIDIIISSAAKLVGFSINRALHGDISIEDMTQFVE